VFQSIVVGTDGSETAQRAVEQAVELAGAVGARLEIVSAYEPSRASACAASARRSRRT
jgi:nucleotide-binding universal stress UspA family protein